MKVNTENDYGYLRLLHGLPVRQNYDCYLDERLYAKDLLFEDFTIYKPIDAGEHQLTLCKHKETESLLTRTIWIAPNRIYTLTITYEPNSESIQFYLLNDPRKKIPDEHFLLRLAPFCKLQCPFELHLDDIKPVFKKLKLSQSSPYLAFLSDTYALQLIDLETATSLLTKNKCLFKPNRHYSLYLLGGTEDFPLRMNLTIDGSSFLSFSDT